MKSAACQRATTTGALLRRSLPLLLTALLGACTTAPPLAPSVASAPAETRLVPCQTWYRALDRQISHAGVRDAGAAPIASHPHLRVDRFSASLRDHLAAAPDAEQAAHVRAALLERLLELDLSARRIEIANLAQPARQALAGSDIDADPRSLLAHTRGCGARLLARDLAEPAATDAMLARLAVPDDYVWPYRVLGLYGLSRVPFLAGVRRWEAQAQARFDDAGQRTEASRRIRWIAPAHPSAQDLGPGQLRKALQPRAGDPLQIPAPTPEQLEALFARHAPVFDFGINGDFDLAGALYWPDDANAASLAPPAVDPARAVVYRHIAHTRFERHKLLQLVYTVWFGARPPQGAGIDLFAGALDGLVWRVTLSPDGEPLAYDSIHPCGCYHMFFPGPRIRPVPAPDPQQEWAFSPRQLPALAPGERIVLRIAPQTHYLEDIRIERDPDGQPHAWQDYDALRTLPLAGGGRRSVFDSDGFIAGTDRAESWLFWPMGIARAGTMRQWGRHATAFVGRRHFDDPWLLDRRFEPVQPDD